MRNSAVRRNSHLGITQTVHSKISYYTLFKIVFLLLFSLIQVYILTSIFGGVKVVNTIYVNANSENSSFNNDAFSNNIVL